MADWLRWWHGTVTDTKFMWVSRKSGARYGDVLAVWSALLEEASRTSDRGDVSRFDADSFDCLLMTDDGDTARIIEAMTLKGLIEGGRLSGWETRQPSREDSGGEGALSSTERSRLHRANKRIEELERKLSELNATQCNAMQRNATHATARVEESRGEESKHLPSSSVVDTLILLGEDEPQPAALPAVASNSIPDPEPTRRGIVCRLLRNAGVADAAPHHLTEETWDALLAKRTNEEIVEFARAKLDAKPGHRIGLKYLVPGLLEDPTPITPKARGSPVGGHLSRDEGRAIAASTRLADFRAAVAAEQGATDERTIEATATPRLLG